MGTTAGKKQADGVYVGGRAAIVEADGYVRRSPVQAVREAPDYRARLVKRAVGVVALLAAVGLALWLIIDKLL